MTLHVRCPGYLGAREQTGPVSNREEQQRSDIHRRKLPGQQDERKGMYGPHSLLIILCPQVVVKFQDDTWLEGFFKDGILHGFCRYFDPKGRLTFVGMHRNGKPFGTCWKVGLQTWLESGRFLDYDFKPI